MNSSEGSTSTTTAGTTSWDSYSSLRPCAWATCMPSRTSDTSTARVPCAPKVTANSSRLYKTMVRRLSNRVICGVI
ncbi:unnamed protein product [Ectocarpus sp. 12 AP-2014]